MRSAIATSEFSTNFPSAERVSGIVSFGSPAMPSVRGRFTPSGNLESPQKSPSAETKTKRLPSEGLILFLEKPSRTWAQVAASPSSANTGESGQAKKHRRFLQWQLRCATEFPQDRLHVLHVSVCAGPPSAGVRQQVILTKQWSRLGATMKQSSGTMGIPYLGEIL